MSKDFSIRMSEDDGIAPPASLFAPRPDKKGPKTIAILLIIGALMMGATAIGDFQSSQAGDLPQEAVDDVLTNVRTSNGENITDAEYQDYHDEVRESGAYTIRGGSVMAGAILIFVGGIMLFRLKSMGPKLVITGSIIAAIGGAYANLEIVSLSKEMLPPSLILAHKIFGYLCGVCMVTCIGLAGLPLLNARARLALYPNPKVVLASEQE